MLTSALYILSLVSVRLYRKLNRQQYEVDFKLRSGWQTHVLFEKCEFSTNVHDLSLMFKKREYTFDVNLKLFVTLSDSNTVNNLHALLYTYS
jgi:diphthamide synthase (EF-2-diphthine--ammonia ligase)